MKALAVLLYVMGNMSFLGIGRILGVSDVAVLKWVRKEAESIPEPEVPAAVSVVTLDEMWHFLKKERKALAWLLGRRDDATAQRLIDKIGFKGRTFIADDWEGFHRLIPEDQLFTGKDLTPACAGAGYPIEQDNSNIRHYLARLRRRTKLVSKCEKMVDLSLRLHHDYHQPENFAKLAATFLSIFG